MTASVPTAVSAVIPAHNPDPDRLRRTLLGLKAQKLSDPFEVIVVNNASERFPDAAFFREHGPENVAVVEEKRLGLTSARLAGFAAAKSGLLVLVDDDNVLAPDYLGNAIQIARECPFLASWSGNVELVFDPDATPPPAIWREYLTERVCTRAVWSNDPSHNDSTPWGAGMCIRRELADKYRAHCAVDPLRLRLDLSGKQLVYGGDTDIAYFGCSLGYGKGVFPQLNVRHLIPRERCERRYLLSAVEGRAYSEWLHHWVLHGEVPSEPRGWARAVKRLLRSALSDPESRATDRARAAGRARAANELRAPR
jgi:glycosyltransferase involved in cell wall biosynthesis